MSRSTNFDKGYHLPLTENPRKRLKEFTTNMAGLAILVGALLVSRSCEASEPMPTTIPADRTIQEGQTAEDICETILRQKGISVSKLPPADIGIRDLSERDNLFVVSDGPQSYACTQAIALDGGAGSGKLYARPVPLPAQ